MTEHRADDLADADADAFVVAEVLGIDVVHVLSDLDIATVGAFSEAIRRTVADRRPIVVDFSSCDYMDSTGLRITAMEYAKLPPGSRIVVPENGTVRRLFVITGFDRALSPVSSLDQALREAAAAAGPNT